MTSKTVITCKGHPNIKGSHAKTFEFTHDDDVTGAGTCIIGVKCEYDEEALLKLRGAVSISLACGEVKDTVQARMNPLFRRGDPLIIRRNNKPQARSLCISASKGSSALSHDLIEALRLPGAELNITITQLNSEETNAGVLYVIGVPIGNPADVTLRALDTLHSVDAVLAEDTRTARASLAEYGVTSEFISYHDHNERERAPQIMDRLRNGDRIALISEAGMPLISDPGYHIVKNAVENGTIVCPVPGPDAVTTALSVSGLSPADFRFIGFLPRKGGARKRLFEQFVHAACAIVFFESPHRIADALHDLNEILGDRQVAVCRDLTKHTEQVIRGTPEQIIAELSAQEKPRGELTIVVSGADPSENDDNSERPDLNTDKFVRALVEEGCPTKILAAALSKTTGMKKREAFNLIVKIKDEPN